jgi:predicted DsbA family dithiol-disulfide isomerase
MAKHSNIDFAPDVVRPWFVVGLGGLEQALANVVGPVQAEIRFQPFELNPTLPVVDRNMDERIVQKYGLTPASPRQCRRTAGGSAQHRRAMQNALRPISQPRMNDERAATRNRVIYGATLT